MSLAFVTVEHLSIHMHDLSKHNGPPTKIAHLLSTHAQGINYNNLAAKGMLGLWPLEWVLLSLNLPYILLHIIGYYLVMGLKSWWNSYDHSVLEKIPEELKDDHETQTFSETGNFLKTFRIEWNFATDQLWLSISKQAPPSAIMQHPLGF